MIEYVPTADGARIAVKRRPTAGGTPIVFVHGLAVNADLWDLPEMRGPGFHYRSLAAVLQEAGHDIWLVNLRGCGAPHMLSTPPPGAADWCVDHFILYDLPAVVAHVRAATGRRPFVIGNSMGAMTISGYLQGATLADAAEGPRIVADEAAARQRQADIAGGVLIEFPAALRWPHSLYDAQGQVQWGALLRGWRQRRHSANYSFELLSRWGWVETLLVASGKVPLQWLGADPRNLPWWHKLPERLAQRLTRVERAVAIAMLKLGGAVTGGSNQNVDVMLQGRRYIMDHLKAGVLAQMAKSVRKGGFFSALGSPDHEYSAHYEAIELPVLVILGGRDRIASAPVTREAFFERVRSADKSIHVFDDIAHGEFEAAPVACERVYPVIRDWLAARAAHEWRAPRSARHSEPRP